MNEKLLSIHKAFIGFKKRAEKSTEEILYNTFVDSAPLFETLSTRNSQVIYGRRGTGKTHALKYLSRHLHDRSTSSIYIDLRSIGSDGALYHDVSKTVAERSVRLILDVLNVIADELYLLAYEKIPDAPHPDQITYRIDDLINSISDVRILGDYKIERREKHEAERGTAISTGLGLSKDAPNIRAGARATDRATRVLETGHQATGAPKFHIEFGRVQGCLRSLLGVLQTRVSGF